MGYADRDEQERETPRPSPTPDVLDRVGDVIGLVVRLVGVALLSVGIAVGLKVVAEVFDLYNQPQTIERFADAIEQGSNLDAVFAPERAPAADDAPARSGPPPLRLSYFAAWIVVLMLLVVVSGIAMSIITTGGRLALGGAAFARRR